MTLKNETQNSTQIEANKEMTKRGKMQYKTIIKQDLKKKKKKKKKKKGQWLSVVSLGPVYKMPKSPVCGVQQLLKAWRPVPRATSGSSRERRGRTQISRPSPTHLSSGVFTERTK